MQYLGHFGSFYDSDLDLGELCNCGQFWVLVDHFGLVYDSDLNMGQSGIFSYLGHFEPFWVILCQCGPFLVILTILGHFVTGVKVKNLFQVHKA